MRLEVRCEDRIGMVREILDLFTPYYIDMRRIEVDGMRGCLYIGFEDVDFSLLTQLLANIRRLPGVLDVKTVQFTPFEREKNALDTLLEALPDGVVAIDLNGIVTMATSQAAQDIGVTLPELLHNPLSSFIKSVRFEKLNWTELNGGVTKRVRLNGQLVLLEMQPFFVANDAAHNVCAGAVIYLRSAQRLGRQASSLRKAPNANEDWQGLEAPEACKSQAMQRCLAFAQAYIAHDGPMLLSGELAVGKKRLLEVIFERWQALHMEYGATLSFVAATSLQPEQLTRYLDQGGWLAIVDVELLSQDCQHLLISWLQQQPSVLYQAEAPTRVIGLSRLTFSALLEDAHFLDELFYLLASFKLSVPPLRERKEDLHGLAKRILLDAKERFNRDAAELTKEAHARLKLHYWPGNLKELESCLYQAVQVVRDGRVQAQDLPLPTVTSMPIELIEGSLDKTVKAYEAELLRKLYPQYPSTRKLAKFLNVSHSSIANKLKEYGIA